MRTALRLDCTKFGGTVITILLMVKAARKVRIPWPAVAIAGATVLYACCRTIDLRAASSTRLACPNLPEIREVVLMRSAPITSGVLTIALIATSKSLPVGGRCRQRITAAPTSTGGDGRAGAAQWPGSAAHHRCHRAQLGNVPGVDPARGSCCLRHSCSNWGDGTSRPAHVIGAQRVKLALYHLLFQKFRNLRHHHRAWCSLNAEGVSHQAGRSVSGARNPSISVGGEQSNDGGESVR